MAEINWADIRAEYVTTGISYRQLEKKYGIARRRIGERAAKEKWVDRRKKYRDKIASRKEAIGAEKAIDRYTRLIELSDRLADKIDKALDELEKHLVTNKKRVRTIEYNNGERPDKPTKEIITDEETIDVIESLVDRDGIKQIAAALKDLKEIQSLRSTADAREQDARIANLERQAAQGEQAGDGAVIEIDGLPEAWRE